MGPEGLGQPVRGAVEDSDTEARLLPRRPRFRSSRSEARRSGRVPHNAGKGALARPTRDAGCCRLHGARGCHWPNMEQARLALRELPPRPVLFAREYRARTRRFDFVGLKSRKHDVCGFFVTHAIVLISEGRDLRVNHVYSYDYVCEDTYCSRTSILSDFIDFFY